MLSIELHGYSIGTGGLVSAYADDVKFENMQLNTSVHWRRIWSWEGKLYVDLVCAFLQQFVFYVTLSKPWCDCISVPSLWWQSCHLCISYEAWIFAFLAAHMQFFSSTFQHHCLGIFSHLAHYLYHANMIKSLTDTLFFLCLISSD